MNKPLFIISSPYDTYSGYGARSRDLIKAIIKTDIAISIPAGYYGRVAPRSGMSWKNHTDIGAGVIDSDYRGAIGVVMFNHSTKDIKIDRDNRVAQLIIEKINTDMLVEVPIEELDATIRGANGYGSTGQ